MHTETCQACGVEMTWAQHPGGWPNHPVGVRVKVECPTCGAAQHTEGITEVEHREQLVAAAMDAEVAHLTAPDEGGGAEDAAS